MGTTLFWYDYETFGMNPRWCGIAQFAGIRTDEDLQMVGQPVMVYCQPPQDSWPDPTACLITGITPQHCRQHGLSDREFAKVVQHELARPGTCGVGFNSIRFDDEFTRQLLYRNFYDPYEREWKNGNSRWDLLDTLRMARALRPEGIEWPLDAQSNPIMKLEALTAANGIEHVGAHDALVDVYATIAMARLLKKAQPEFYEHAFQLRSKDFAAQWLDLIGHVPVLHTSGKLGGKRLSTALVMPLMLHPTNSNGVLVFDLMQDPVFLIDLSADEIRQRLFTANADLGEGVERIAVKTVHKNKSPMLAPVAWLDAHTEERLGIDRDVCRCHWKLIKQQLPNIVAKLNAVFQQPYEAAVHDAEFLIYSGFVGRKDKQVQDTVRKASSQKLMADSFVFEDDRLNELLFRYRARNFPECLSDDERAQWLEFRQHRLHHKISDDWLTKESFLSRIAELEQIYIQQPDKMALLSELQAWALEVD